MSEHAAVFWNWGAFDYEHPVGAAFLTTEAGVAPDEHWEVKATRACVRSLDLLERNRLTNGPPSGASRLATDEEILRCHSDAYLSGLTLPASKVRAARLSAAMSIEATRSVLTGLWPVSYVFTRPAGHHAERDRALGGCVFNNAALAAASALVQGLERVAILDWDVHHGNGAQDIFWNDPRVLTTSIHQEVPATEATSGCNATGGADAERTNLNIPLPPGSGWEAYALALDAFDLACARFDPQLVIVASGLDASTLDPGGRMMLHSRAYADLAARARAVANRHAEGRMVFTHEGGYAVEYVPLCVAAIIAGASGDSTLPSDPYYERWEPFSGDKALPHQEAAVAKARHALGLDA